MNFALTANGGVATASSSFNSPPWVFTAAGANNGIRSGAGWGQGEGWNDNAPENTFPDWLQIDFNGSKTIDEIDMFTAQDNWQSPSEPTEAMTFSLYGLIGFDVQYWNGGSWTTLTGGSVTGNNKVWKKITFAAITTTKIRVLTNASVDGYSRIVELEAWGAAPPSTNVALSSNGGVATASSSLNSPPWVFTAAGANNGVRSGTGWGQGEGWNDDAPANTFPDWLQIDFNGSKTIDEIDVFTAQDNWQSPSEPTGSMTFSLYGLTAFDVQYWTGSTWATVPNGSITGNNKVWRRINFVALTTTKIRVVSNASVDGYSRLTEVEAWDTPATGSGSSPSDYAMSRLDPANRTGTGGEDLLSNNFNWAIPLVSLPGRAGLDLGLALSYNSLVWTRAGSHIAFDPDDGAISPGFRLGFPVVEGPYWNSQANTSFYLLVTPSGGRVELRNIANSTVYESADSAHLQLIDYGTNLLVRPTDGTQLNFTTVSGGWRCNNITDRNGNFISVTYKSWGEIETITDTLGRVLTFVYDANANIQEITQSWAGQTHKWATFGWATIPIGNNFPGLTNHGPNSTSIPALNQVGLPDGSRYNFDYNGYGQVSAIHYYAADNHQRRYVSYVYGAASTDCPRIIERRDWAENWNGINGVPAEVVTQFSHQTDGACQMTMADGTIVKEYYGSTWQSGLTTQSEIWSGGIKQKWTTAAWTQDNTNVAYQTNPRLIETNIYDASGNRRRMTIDYGGYAQWGLPNGVFEYAANGTSLLRVTYTDYNLSQAYLDRRIIGLVSAIHMSDGAWQSKTTYGYDDPTQLQATSATTIRHDAAYGTSLTARGNLTSVSRWDTTDVNTLVDGNKALTSRIGYDTNGSLVWSRDPAGHQTNVSYDDSFSDTVNRNTLAYPTKVKDADWNASTAPDNYSTAQYHFDFGAVTRTQGPKPAGQTQGAIQTMLYDSAGRIERVTTENNGAFTQWVYTDYSWVAQYDTIQEGQPARYTATVWDGAGRVRAVGGSNPGSTGGFWGRFTNYDIMGRPNQQTNPAEINGGWAPVGDDASGWVVSYQSYDWKGRPLVTTNQDGTQKYASYGGCGCAGGEVLTLTDEVGRQQKVYADVFGRQWKNEVLNWNGTVYATTTNTYNSRDQVTLVRQWAGAENGGTYQDTTMSYDGYGRLKTKHVSEQDANTGTVYAYNADDTINSVTDARGASASYSYNNRHLVTGITYSVPQGSGIPATPNVTFGYDATGNRISMTDGLGSQAYAYNELSRMTSEGRTFTGLSGSFTLSYEYNLAGELKKITDATGMEINYGYDSSGRLTGVTGSGNLYANVSAYASSFQYRAWGALKAMTDGTSHGSSISYNPRLDPSQFDISGNVVHQNYDYYNDGRISFVHNTTDSNFDRSYFYDHITRLTENKTGGQARGDNGDAPYHETFAYDSFDNLNGRVTQTASGQTNISDSGSYTNNRRADWGYDADGRILQIGTRYYGNDAAGNSTGISAQQLLADGSHIFVSLNNGHDGNGVKVKESTSNYTTYYVRSSVMGGSIIEEINSAGQKSVGYVYDPEGGQLASQASGVVTWKTNTPIGTTQYSLSNTSIVRTEFDPMGADVSLIAPEEAPPSENQGDIGIGHFGGNVDSRWSDVFNPSAGCSDMGIARECSRISRLRRLANPGFISAARNGWDEVGPVHLLEGLVNFVQDATTFSHNTLYHVIEGTPSRHWPRFDGFASFSYGQDPRKQGPSIEDDKEQITSAGTNCGITVNFNRGGHYRNMPQLLTGPSTMPHPKTGAPSFGLGFMVSGWANTGGGVGHMAWAGGDYTIPSNPGGSWTITQTVASYISVDGQIDRSNTFDTRPDISPTIQYDVSGNTFYWYDHPGGTRTAGVERRNIFTVSVSNGTETCSLTFHVVQTGTTIHWGEGGLP